MILADDCKVFIHESARKMQNFQFLCIYVYVNEFCRLVYRLKRIKFVIFADFAGNRRGFLVEFMLQGYEKLCITYKPQY